uniref:Ubiquitin carboxyl-terminal hydrolase MINDY n=1 Tax=Scophthalmus maximus TaxID=52904 RepID=A0A8D3DDR7_SCOMX
VMAVSVEEVSSSVVREYLSRKGLKRTIACMDEEHPRTEASVNNRSHLRQILNIESLYRGNKVSVVLLFVGRRPQFKCPNDVKRQQKKHGVPPKTPVTEHTQRSKTNRITRGMMAGPIATDGLRLFFQMILMMMMTLFETSPKCPFREPSWNTSVQAARWTNTSPWWVIYDRVSLETLGTVVSAVAFNFPECFSVSVFPQELKAVLLGSSLSCFSVEWRNQGFSFSETHDLRYGIVQKKGGPCGVLASVQAIVLKKLLFENTESRNEAPQRFTPSSHARKKCLVLAVAEILWRAGEEKRATVALSSGRNHFTPTGHYKSEGVFEKVWTHHSRDTIEKYVLK